ncbi:MAG: hypothetical protein IGR80_10830 [Synechococcales cyanobacterium K44_A2020_017]|nr:hypothetical protein [Synechococcales cyanobacterium K32_A2020_035]MBF2095237.1 hypothetical protein [Synechococcales cyanobacterium K44_A2020_017]
MNYSLLALVLAPPVLTVVYACLEHSGKLDIWFGRRAALDGLDRLKSASGYPTSWIYNDDKDRVLFTALEKRISKRTQVKKISKVLAEGHRPSCITVGGEPIPISGVHPEWESTQKRVYTPAHSVMYLFNVTRDGGQGKAERVGTLGELEKWLSDEKDVRKHYIGAVALGFIAITFIVLRFVTTG